MTRRLHECRHCATPENLAAKFRRGLTRHKDRVCSHCRRNGPWTPTPNYKGRAA